ncbi:alpha/beta fold hydrolase [Saccharomonospora xinjiangensis]|uniref:Putative hydrolase or acyltransferase of alpha/beta superfamily n=1 Tax=Saccharomonospora xinjiangensis XJ-54 TaxID=882086 RepID=I0V3S0_9PSEU|nr:alpha/beta hydrolase [Saccharomonospora xinjiangensis]EID54773.1 putative hydrolase or acyltransferase of alpha/beta superfamily [Saccharomonospora xinjiangensis XJ-54]
MSVRSSLASSVVDFGGTGRPIVLLHGLMGRATTWWPVSRWLTAYGHVVGLDARGHGRARRPGSWTTEEFADDVAELVRDLGEGPAVLIGHSMGGLHAWVAAARNPELVAGVVVEDMAVDRRGDTVDPWRAYFESWPVPFRSLAQVSEFFGGLGDYFVECVEERDDGYHLMANLDDLYAIATEWGERDYWSYLEAVRCPMLVIEAGHTDMPEGQQAEMARRARNGRHLVVADAGHVVHHDQPEVYRGAVEAFLSALP